jgi:hypothetical protein
VIDDDMKLHGEVSITDQGISENFGCEYGVGIVAVRKTGGGSL